MNTLQISTDPTRLSDSLTTSPSVSAFLPEEDASTCCLLPTPSPPLDFTHPLTPNIQDGDNDEENIIAGDDPAETSSSGSSAIGMVACHLNTHYHHLKEVASNAKIQENGVHAMQNGNIPMKKMPNFVHWNWPLIRKVTFFIFMSGIFAMVAIVVAMIVNLPKTCNPKSAWYRGSVFYEIFPASFQDSGNDGMGDLGGISLRADYIKNLGVGVVRLNSIFPSPDYPHDYQDVKSLTEVDKRIGKIDDLKKLSAFLHERNISIVLDIPIFPFFKRLQPATIVLTSANETGETDVPTSEFLRLSRATRSLEEQSITDIMRFWMSRAAIDGFYLKGLEKLAGDPHLVENIREWKYVLGSDRALIVSKKLIDNATDDVVDEIIKNVDLVDVFLDIPTFNGTENMANYIKTTLGSKLAPGEGPWIHWRVGGVDESRLASYTTSNITLAAMMMELMLPGSPSIFYGDEIAIENILDKSNDHLDTKHLHHLPTMMWDNPNAPFTNRAALPWLPESANPSFNHIDSFTALAELRKKSPAMYQNSVNKEGSFFPNTNIRSSKNDLLIVERSYPRRNSFVAISNFGNKKLNLDLTSMFYSGELLIGGAGVKNIKIYFKEFEMDPFETIIVKLHK